ncbi:hypothetical protein EGW08_001649 [Elysia chlorotica]|uniref:C2H2-type domain-containing protein n=1 Tax=Elysia chlorotica TaxID=188477 RepID=A0A3S1BKS1_ELYCH|nr:hypothetical protein EGW08_001649 [Elysia chlorotica]
MAFSDNSYQVTGKVCPPSLPMTMMLPPDLSAGPPVLPSVLQSVLSESLAQESRTSLPENLCAVVAQAQVLLSTNEDSSMSSVVSLPYFFCNFCDHHTDSRALLLKHLAQNHVFQCNLCSFSSLSRGSLIQHQLRAHIDAKELFPILSSKFVQVSLPQLQRTFRNNDGFSGRSPQQNCDRDETISQVSSATSCLEDNILPPDPQVVPDSEDHGPVSTTHHGNSQFRDSFLTPETNSAYKTEPLLHFLDVEHTSVSSSNVSSQIHGSCVNEDNSARMYKEMAEGTIIRKSVSNTAPALRSDAPVEHNASSSPRVSLSGEATAVKENGLFCSPMPKGSQKGNSSIYPEVGSKKQRLQSRELDNFLIDEEPCLENGQKQGNYDILRGLLVGESSEQVDNLPPPAQKKCPTPEGVQYSHCSPAMKESDSTVGKGKVSAVTPLHEKTQRQRASDMSLRDLLLQPSTSCNLGYSGPLESSVAVVLSGATDRHSSAAANPEVTLSSKTKLLPPDSCIASEMLRTLSQNVSGSEKQNAQIAGALSRFSYSSQPLGRSKDRSQDTSAVAGETSGAIRKSHRLKKKCVYVDSVSISDDEWEADETRYSGKKKLPLKRHRDENEDIDYNDKNDVEYIYENDEAAYLSEDSYCSSSDSGNEEKRRMKCKRLKVGMTHREKYENLGITLTCLHCSFSNGNRHILRNHLRVCHPLCVPFAETSVKSGKKTIVYLCQGFNGRCSFVSSKASEIFSHIKLCFVELLDGFHTRPQGNFSSVLSSLGIASKLMGSGPSTYYCLRCDFREHSLQPVIEHALGKHAGSVSGILHVTIGTQQPKHTKVHMVCLSCKSEASVKEWQFHPCRLYEEKGERESNGVNAIDEEISNGIPASQPFKEKSRSNDENFLEKNIPATQSSELDHFVSAEDCLKSEPPDKEIIVKEENIAPSDVDISPVDEFCNRGEQINAEKNNAIASSHSGKQLRKDNNMCVISNCFSMNPNFDSKLPPTISSQSITETLLTSPADRSKPASSSSSVLPVEKATTEIQSPLCGAGSGLNAKISSSKNPDTLGSTSVLHSLLVSNPPDVSSTQALNLLQNLLRSKTTAETPTSATLAVSREQPLRQPISNLPSLKQSGLEKTQSRELNRIRPVSVISHDENIANNSKPTLSNEIKPSNSAPHFHAENTGIDTSQAKDDLSSQPVKPCGHEDLLETPGPSAPPQQTGPGEPLAGTSQGTSTGSQHSSVPLFLPQIQSHLKPASASAPLPVASRSPVQDSLRSRLFPASSSAPLHSSPFTNLLRGLLSMSQKKDKDSKQE